MPRSPSILASAALVALTALAASPCAAQATAGSVIDALKAATAQSVPQAAVIAALSPVREAALRDTARILGAQAGLGEESRRILRLIQADEPRLDAQYRFGELIMGAGILPAVISEASNAAAVEGSVMRLAIGVYRIDEPARPVLTPPTWRDWLLVGLNPDLQPQPPGDPNLLPRDEAERTYWRRQLEEAYSMGVSQARQIAEINIARLERTYLGMRKFYELYERGMVTAPQVVTSYSVIDREDPNTVAVGTTVFKIVQGTDFVEKYERWRPLGR